MHLAEAPAGLCSGPHGDTPCQPDDLGGCDAAAAAPGREAGGGEGAARRVDAAEYTDAMEVGATGSAT
jgi:hypothetical protein